MVNNYDETIDKVTQLDNYESIVFYDYVAPKLEKLTELIRLKEQYEYFYNIHTPLFLLLEIDKMKKILTF